MPVFRVICNECTEAGKDRPVEALYVPLRLRVIRGSVQIGDEKMAANGLEELAGELPPLSKTILAGGPYAKPQYVQKARATEIVAIGTSRVNFEYRSQITRRNRWLFVDRTSGPSISMAKNSSGRDGGQSLSTAECDCSLTRSFAHSWQCWDTAHICQH